MSKMRTSGIVGIAAVIVGMIGFSLSWIDRYLAGVKISSQTGFELIDGTNDPMIIILLLAAGVLVSAVSFAMNSAALRGAFVVLGLAVVLICITDIQDVTSYVNVPLLGITGAMAGTGFFVELGAGAIMIVAAACPRTK